VSPSGSSGGRRIEIAASILDADLGRLADEVARAAAAGVDRIHLDVMDAHFVPNLTFGPKTIKAIRGASDLPFDAHLMIEEPGRWLDEYLDAGCDTVTFHVEVVEPKERTLEAIRAAGRGAGLSLRPGTPFEALLPYADLLDIVMVMTVEPGFGGQTFMPGPAQRIADGARLLRERGRSGGVHDDGGVNRDTAAIAGAYGVDVLVVGSALWRAGDLAAEVAAIRELAQAAAPRTPATPGATYAAVHPRPAGR
jgi:ribulose-phosphate 3-epimerase